MYKAIIFDLDGTLADTLGSIAEICNKTLNHFGFRSIDKEEYKYLIGNGTDVLLSRILKTVDETLDPWELPSFKKRYLHFYETDPLKHVTAYEGITKLLEKLQENDIKICVLSNKDNEMTNFIVKNIFPNISFSQVLGKTDKFPTKPDPKSLEHLLSVLKTEKSETLYVGDSGVDMLTANNAKLDCAGVLWGFRAKDELEENRATYTVNNTAELEKIIFS